MTDQDYIKWLKDSSAAYTFLVEVVALVGGVATTFYLSTNPYSTKSTDVPANVIYLPVASLGSLFKAELSLDNSDSSFSQGGLDVDNNDGERDDWYTYVWANNDVTVYIGDIRWPRADFRRVFTGKLADIAPNGQSKITLKLRDKLQQINTPVTDVQIGGTGQYKDSLVPVPFGELHNVTPVPEEAALLTYRLSLAAMERIAEVRDNGVPLDEASAPTIDLANGRIRLNKRPEGTITVDLQGDNVGGYRNTCAALIRRIVTGYGDASKRFTDADIDLQNFADFDAAHRQAMGVWCPDRVNILDVCQMLAGSIGAQLYMTSDGLLRIIQLTGQATGTPFVISEADMETNSMTPVKRTDPVGAVRFNFCKNWTVQEGLTSDILQEHKDLYAKEWLLASAEDASILATYKQSAAEVAQDNMLLVRTEAQTEAQRQLDMWKNPRMVYEFNGLPQMFTLELGQTIKVFYHRYGMQNGVNATVISLARNWKNRRVKVGFLV